MNIATPFAQHLERDERLRGTDLRAGDANAGEPDVVAITANARRQLGRR